MSMARDQPKKSDNDGVREHDLPGPSEIDVRAQLKRILSSAEFSVPERLRRFLIYVIDETLAGRPQRIKAYSVAVEVFGRNANLETQSDPVVRIEAGRLRRALERYYLLAGSYDPVLIDIPKGGYVPRFRQHGDHSDGETIPQSDFPRKLSFGQFIDARLRHSGLAATVIAVVMIAIVALIHVGTPLQPTVSAEGSDRPEGPSLIIKPFLNLSGTPEGDFYVAGLGDELLVQFARFKELTVFGRETSGALSPGASVAEIGNRFSSRYVLEGSVRFSEGKLRVTSRVLDGESSAIVWSGSYEVDPRANAIVDMQMTIASKVATAVAQPYGVIFNTLPRPTPARSAQSLEAYRCTFRFYRYRAELGQSGHAQTRECLELITTRYPEHATGWAMLSYLYLDEDRFQLNRRPGPPEPAERARATAERAVRIDPENVRALQALMTVLFFSKEPAEALKVGSQALALNPNDTELLGEFGSQRGPSRGLAGRDGSARGGDEQKSGSFRLLHRSSGFGRLYAR
jgi:TolB-like protein